jgi:hypothetical protein
MPARKVTAPKPLEHWFGDIAAISRLREIISDPVYQLACATLSAAAQPTYSSIVSGASNNERLCWLGGYSDFYRDLQKLTVSPVSKAAVMEEWSHID